MAATEGFPGGQWSGTMWRLPSPPSTSKVLAGLSVPIVLAPMAGGPSTPALAAGVNRAGGLGFMAAGYLTPERMREEIDQLRTLSDRNFGVNLFVGGGTPADARAVQDYAARIDGEARRAGVALGEPRFDDDSFEQKVAAL